MEQGTEQNSTGGDAGGSFPTLAEVLVHLQDSGWKESKTSLHRRAGEGKLLPEADGSYALKSVEKYARTWLKQKSTGKRVNRRMDELQQRRAELEVENLELDRERKRRAVEKERDSYCTIEQMAIELTTKAGILEAGLKHWIQSHAAEWIRLAGGEVNKVGELINLMNRQIDEHITNYALLVEFDTVIGPEEEIATEATETGSEEV